MNEVNFIGSSISQKEIVSLFQTDKGRRNTRKGDEDRGSLYKGSRSKHVGRLYRIVEG